MKYEKRIEIFHTAIDRYWVKNALEFAQDSDAFDWSLVGWRMLSIIFWACYMKRVSASLKTRTHGCVLLLVIWIDERAHENLLRGVFLYKL